MRGNLADLAATGLASEPTLRKWIAAEPEQPWIIKRGSNGDAYEIDIPGAVQAFRARQEAEAQAARQRADSIKQLALELGIGSAGDEQSVVQLSIAERRQLLEEELVAIRVAEKRGELVSFASVAAAFGDVLVRFRQRGETFAARLAKKIDLTRAQIAAIERLMETDQAALADWMGRMEVPVGDVSADSSGDRAATALEDPPAPDRRRRRSEPGTSVPPPN